MRHFIHNKTNIFDDNGTLKITVSADNFAKFVRLDLSETDVVFSDNYFDLLPGESRTVTMKIDEKLDERQQLESFSLMCANAIPAKSSELYDLKERARVFIKPENLGQWVYYGQKGRQE